MCLHCVVVQGTPGAPDEDAGSEQQALQVCVCARVALVCVCVCVFVCVRACVRTCVCV